MLKGTLGAEPVSNPPARSRLRVHLSERTALGAPSETALGAMRAGPLAGTDGSAHSRRRATGKTGAAPSAT